MCAAASILPAYYLPLMRANNHIAAASCDPFTQLVAKEMLQCLSNTYHPPFYVCHIIVSTLIHSELQLFSSFQ